MGSHLADTKAELGAALERLETKEVLEPTADSSEKRSKSGKGSRVHWGGDLADDTLWTANT